METHNERGGMEEMSRRLLNLAGLCALTLALAAVALAQTQPTQSQQPTQTTVTTQTAQAVQNPDGTWTVIQYPTGKEVVVDFTPTPTFSTGKGHAKILRTGDKTAI